MLALATRHLGAASVVLDVGCRDASHLIELVRATGATGVGIDGKLAPTVYVLRKAA